MREHEVPTHLQTEDKVLLGLTFPQIVAIAAVVGLAYGLWKQAAFLPDGGASRLEAPPSSSAFWGWPWWPCAPEGGGCPQ